MNGIGLLTEEEVQKKREEMAKAQQEAAEKIKSKFPQGELVGSQKFIAQVNEKGEKVFVPINEWPKPDDKNVKTANIYMPGNNGGHPAPKVVLVSADGTEEIITSVLAAPGSAQP